MMSECFISHGVATRPKGTRTLVYISSRLAALLSFVYFNLSGVSEVVSDPASSLSLLAAASVFGFVFYISHQFFVDA